ncbi:MAG: HU family DNA-binding protein [Litoreibacter sp.]|uniref:HU family DNA-binding protein n=1 Tax=Litoreibacter sp. TaxID=1969459 RepID=UPI003299D69B
MASKPKPTKTTKTKRSTTRAASTTPKAATKKSSKAKVVSTKSTPVVAQADGAEVVELSKKEMVERMVASSGMKKGEARRAFEATMEVLAQALREGHNMSLPPLGKIKIARTKDTPNGKMVVMRAKLKDPESSTPKEPLAEAAE